MEQLLYITPFYPCSKHPYLTPYIARLVEGIANAFPNIRITVITTSCTNKMLELNKCKNIKIVRVPSLSYTTKLENLGFIISSVAIRILRLNKNMLIHAHWMDSALTASYIMQYFPRTYSVCTIHESIRLVQLCKNGFDASKRKLRYLRKMNALIVPSSWSKNKLLRCGFEDKHIEVIHHGFGLEFRNGFTNVSHNGCLRIVFAKHFETIYGADLLPELIARIVKDVPNVFFHFIGDGSLKQNIMKSIPGYIHKVCYFHGYLSNSETIKIMKLSDVFLSLSRFESFGVSTLEALASGCVVLASDIQPNRELVQNAGFLFSLTSDGFENLIGFIKRLSSDNRMLGKLKKRSLKRAKEYPVSRMVSEHFQLYSSFF